MRACGKGSSFPTFGYVIGRLNELSLACLHVVSRPRAVSRNVVKVAWTTSSASCRSEPRASRCPENLSQVGLDHRAERLGVTIPDSVRQARVVQTRPLDDSWFHVLFQVSPPQAQSKISPTRDTHHADTTSRTSPGIPDPKE